MQLILVFNYVVLGGLILFLCREEWRFRHFSKKIAQTKEDLTSIVHQLRSPLSNLRKYNEFLQSKEFGTLSFAQQEAISKVQSSLSESLMLLGRLLARSRLEESKVALEPTSLFLRDIVDGACEVVRSSLKHKEQELIVKVDGQPRVSGDPLLLHGILDEILANAIHYTPKGGTITVIISETNTTASVAVMDTGIGISQTERPHVFDKFFRGERARTMFTGNGLGLPFAQKFATTLGGSVRFTSKENAGSTFTVSLPKNSQG